MKQMFTFIVVTLLCATNLNAQQIQVHGRTIDLNQLRLQHLQQLQHSKAPLRTTVIKQRVTNESTYYMGANVPMMLDSNRYIYSGYNGSVFTPGSYGFDFYFPTLISIGDNGESYSTMDIHADSLYSWVMDTVTYTLQLSEKIFTGFYNNQNIHFYEDHLYGSQPDDYRYENIYNSQGKLIRMNEFQGYPTSLNWDTSARRRYFYDAQGRLTDDSLDYYDFGDWVSQVSIHHTYDASGNEIQATLFYNTGTAWQALLQLEQTFNANNEAITFILKQSMGSGLQPYSKDSIEYTSGLATTYWHYTYQGNSWVNTQMVTNHFNAQQLVDTVLTYLWSVASTTYEPSDKLVFTYNGYNNPTTRYEYSYIGSTPMFSTQHNFYYEEYNDLSGIHDQTTKAAIKAYPNPANDVLFIEWENANRQPVTVQMINAAGQLVSNNIFSAMHTTERISISSLTPGIYFLNIINNKGESLHKQTLIKQ